jgi:general secretion pathway protein D
VRHTVLVPLCRVAVLCLATALSLSAAEPSAANLFKQGRKAERGGDVVSAYLLYSEAAAKAPSHPEYWARAQALRTRAALVARPMPAPSPPETRAPEAEQTGSGPSSGITAEDLEEVRRLRPPPELKPTPGRKDLDLRGDAKAIFEQTARAFGLEAVFDGDYQPGPPLHIRIDDADYRQALHTLAVATGSFVVPLSARVFLVAKDTPPKRADVEPVVAVSIPIPEPVSVQEAQELARAVQQAMEIVKLVVDANRRIVVIRDRVSKVRPAQALFEQLARSRAQVAIEVQFLEVDKSSLISYGLLLPNDFPIVFVGTGGAAGAIQSLASFLFGHPMFGLGIANAEMFASMSRSLGKNLLEAEVRSLDGATVTFHVGEKYPIASAAFLGQTVVPPTFTFEDLGLSLKITPHVHGMDEVSLDVNAEFKMLAGQSANGMPILSNRKMESKVRLKNGQWAIVAGLMSASEARTITGTAGLSSLPVIGRLFRKNDVDSQSTEVVLVLKPMLLDPPPSESVNSTLYLGSEGRLNIPL